MTSEWLQRPRLGAAREKTVLGATMNHLIPRGGTADEVAKGVMFVVENEFVTGTTIDVDGGWLLDFKSG